MYISNGSYSTNTTPIVNTTESRVTTQRSYERDPIIPHRPIQEEVSVPFGARDNFSSPIIGAETAGQHINLTV